jgi:glycosyltransferase involved in cell wall biosynthesis
MSPFDYYGIPEAFSIRRLRNIDLLAYERVIPSALMPAAFFLNAFLWSFYAALIARRQRADIYFTRYSTLAFWLVQFGLPTILEVHEMPERLQRQLLRMVAHKRSLLGTVSVTSFGRQELIDIGFPPQKVITALNGVDPELFSAIPNRNECRCRLGLPQERPIIGYTGRFRTLDMEKGIPELIQTLPRIAPVADQEPLLLCVGGPMDVTQAYHEQARSLGIPEHQLMFVDRVPNADIPLWIGACDVVTIPWPWNKFSAYYTSPVKRFEYMASGVPIVASDLPSLREVLCNGENAVLVQAGDVDALATGLNRVLQNPDWAARIGQQARCDAQKNTWHKRAEQILQAASGRVESH